MATSRTKTKSKSKSKSTASWLGKVGTKPATISKSKTPVVQVTDQKQIKAIAAIVEAKKEHAAAISALKVAEGGFRDAACKHYETRCQTDGTLHTSVKLVGQFDDEAGGETLSVGYTQTRRCCQMKEAEAMDPLCSVFGNNFDALFVPKRTIEIETGVLSDEQIDEAVDALRKIFGDTYDSAVTVDSLIIPKEAFFGKRVLDPKIHKLAARAAADGYAVPFTASFKL